MSIEVIAIEGRPEIAPVAAAYSAVTKCVDAMPKCFFKYATVVCRFPCKSNVVEFHVVTKDIDLVGYNKFMMQQLSHVTSCDYVLVVQHDGYIIHPELWDNRWLQYDYIGAPWVDDVVGNGGFSLRSRKFIEASKGLPFLDDVNEDWQLCRNYRLDLENMGIVFAPLEVAERFSVETRVVNFQTFGFHGERCEYALERNQCDFV